jgi:hypothetical protein
MTGICLVWYVYRPISENSKFSNIIRETASKSIVFWPYNKFFKLDVLWKKKLAPADNKNNKYNGRDTF